MTTRELVTVQIASLPERHEMLRQTIKSLHQQADRIHVALNSYSEIPDWFGDYPNVFGMIMDNSTGDAAKFHNVENLNGYIFTCDDDIAYPNGYMEYMTGKIEKYERKVIVSLHGRVTLPKPVRTYYKSWIESFHCLKKVPTDRRVNVAGTGVMAWHSSTIKLRYEDFRLPNMADIWMAKFASQQNVPLFVVAHPEGYITLLDPACIYPTIWHKHYNDDKQQTDLYNSF